MKHKNWKYVFYYGILPIAIFLIFKFFFYLLVEYQATITNTDVISSYQFRHLRIVYISSCVTALALIVALLRDEIRSIWRFAKLVVEPKSVDFLNEEVIVIGTDIRAESYNITLNIKNTGSIAAKDCSIIVTELLYESVKGTGTFINVDVSLAKELNWIGKNKDQVLIPSNGGSAQVAVVQIEQNTSSEAGAAQSQPAKFSIGGIDLTNKTNPTQATKWLSTFMIFSDTCRPIIYKMEISWDGTWQNRKNEMLQHINIGIIKKV